MTPSKKAVPGGWHFDNSYVRLPSALYSRLNPSPVPSPQLLVFNRPLADSLGLDTSALAGSAGALFFSGNSIPLGAEPIAQAYAGHQFGSFTNLGDGRAILLGEHLTAAGERWDIQLKGSGPTPYSRRGDGRAALGPMLREYLISEAMHALGILTTRSLAVVSTGESVIREKNLPGALLTRVAASHIRVGTFQYVASTRDIDLLRTLADYTIERHFSPAQSDPGHSSSPYNDNPYLSLLHDVISRQARLIAQWQLIGFIHGVMNTDNMALSGETIDYGPCAFMDSYDPQTVFSSIDRNGRYAYGNQPAIAQWNLGRFAETLLPLIHTDQAQAVQLAQQAVDGFMLQYYRNWLIGMRHKLGLDGESPEDAPLINELLRLMQLHQLDYTNTFIALTYNEIPSIPASPLPEFQAWVEAWQDRRKLGTLPQEAMAEANPAVIPRNHQVEAALNEGISGNFEPFEKLLAVLSKPYTRVPEHTEYTLPPEPSDKLYQTFCGT